jgi:uncharacterized protein
MSRGRFLLSSQSKSLYALLLAIVIFLVGSLQDVSESIEIPKFSARVNDLPPLLLGNYRADLEARLRRYEEKTGHAVVIVVIPNLEGEEINSFARKLFETRQLGRIGSVGTILILIAKREEQVAVETSGYFQDKFSEFEARQKVHAAFKRSLAANGGERGMEAGVQAMMEVIDPWFSMLEPPSNTSGLVPVLGTQVVAVIVVILAPVVGSLIGFLLIISTRVGKLQAWARLLSCGCCGSVVVVAMALLLRPAGGIAPGLVYYSASMGFIVSALIGGLSHYWGALKITDRLKGYGHS